MNLRGLYKFSLVDYPGKVSCILFTGGCNFRCSFCHNPCFVLAPNSQPRVTETEVFNFLHQRQKLLDGVVISGGEPFFQPDLVDFVEKVRQTGLLVKVDTNGSFPDLLEQLLVSPGVDALGIDYKTSAELYPSITNCTQEGLASNVQRSIGLGVQWQNSHGLQLDIRTTVHRHLHSEAILQQMYTELLEMGVSRWMLQQYNPVEVIDPDLSEIETYCDAYLTGIARRLSQISDKLTVQVRGTTGIILG